MVTRSQAYLLCDGGYHKWKVLICPMGTNQEAVVRKDIECTFGILKSRFRFFKNALQGQSPKVIDNAFMTVCILHNMLLMNDHIDVHWENNVNWQQLHPPSHHTDDDVDQEGNVINDTQDDERHYDWFDTNFNCHCTEVAVEYEDGYDDFYKELVINYIIRLFNHELQWPKAVGTTGYKKVLMKAKQVLRRFNVMR